ncbi:MAG TPA: hypothetical protein DDX92_06180 [Flavobacteriales bacterium]|jgi:opacity protein-like surface antigen|nr:hypothetical protein [Flavobacteriales bacterium]
MKKIIIVTVILLVGFQVSGQNFFGFSYNTALPLGETNDFVDNYSWGIGGLEWKKFMNDNVAIGMSFSWQVFRNKVNRGTVQVDDNTTVNGTQLRYLNFFPVTATATYHFNPEGSVIPYGTAGVGAYRVLQRFDISGFVFDENTWNFGFYPEIGVIVPSGGNVNFWFNTRYHYILEAGDSFQHQFLNFNIGFCYLY